MGLPKASVTQVSEEEKLGIGPGPLKARQRAEVIYEEDAEAGQAEQGRQRE